jgi:hypothetical protein
MLIYTIMQLLKIQAEVKVNNLYNFLEVTKVSHREASQWMPKSRARVSAYKDMARDIRSELMQQLYMGYLKEMDKRIKFVKKELQKLRKNKGGRNEQD